MDTSYESPSGLSYLEHTINGSCYKLHSKLCKTVSVSGVVKGGPGDARDGAGDTGDKRERGGGALSLFEKLMGVRRTILNFKS